MEVMFSRELIQYKDSVCIAVHDIITNIVFIPGVSELIS